MRHITSTEPMFVVSDAALGSAAAPATALAQSALQLTRAAIARWSGGTMSPAAPARDRPRISPQARWVAQAQYGLAAWIARGGFSQPDESTPAPLPTPVMHNCAALSARARGMDACID